MFKDFTFSQKCVLIKTDAPFGPLDSMWACQRSNSMCRSVRCQPGLINRGEITINKKKTIFNRCCCWLVPWSWLWLGTLTLRCGWSCSCFTFAINCMQNFVIWTKITFIWSLATRGLDLPQMILLLMIISAINGKYFLIKTSDNDTCQEESEQQQSWCRKIRIWCGVRFHHLKCLPDIFSVIFSGINCSSDGKVSQHRAKGLWFESHWWSAAETWS